MRLARRIALGGCIPAVAVPGTPSFGDAVKYVHLRPAKIGEYELLLGKETAVSSKPFHVLPGLVDADIVAGALRAASVIAMDDHDDEADWLPAFEVYTMERGEPVLGVSPPEVLKAIHQLGERAVPLARLAYDCPTCVVCTSFVRRYLPNERVRVPSHFDVTAFATVILPLSPSSNYSGGFFVQPGAHVDSRRFVPLEAGDVIVHDFTLNHGIEVLGGGRYSLVLWVSQTKADCDGSRTPWHAERATAGDHVAQHILGMMYSHGNGAPKDDELALRWTSRAAAGGLASAQFSVATMYFDGQGSPANYTRALYWYAQAAVQGDASAQLVLARMYDQGVGTIPDRAKAQYWYRRGSSQKSVALTGPTTWPTA